MDIADERGRKTTLSAVVPSVASDAINSLVANFQ